MQIILYIIPLFFTTLLSYKPLTFKNTQILLLIGMIFEAVSYTLMDYNILYIILYAALGELSHFISIGIFADKTFKKNYQTILLALGLFPLLLSVKISIIYIVTLIFFTALLKAWTVYRSGRNYHITTMNKKMVKGKLSPANYQEYLTSRKISLTAPFIASLLSSIILSIITFI